jgi:hypothetical protein
VLGFWNWIYDIAAIRADILRVYNEPWAAGQPASAIASDYAPWFFGGFGAAYGLSIALLEIRVRQHGLPGYPETALWLLLGLALCVLVPVVVFILHSFAAHGHSGTRPVAKKEVSPCEP